MCARCAQDVRKMCARCVQSVLNMCARYVQGVLNMCARCVQDVLNMCERCMHMSLNPTHLENIAHVWSFKHFDFVYLQDVQGVRKMCARCVQGVCKVCARCAQDVCKMCARCVQGVLNMCARCMHIAHVMFDMIETHEFRKYSTSWVLEKSEEPCRILKKFVHACVVNVIHAKGLPGFVFYNEH